MRSFFRTRVWLALFAAMLLGVATAQAQTTYDLWIGGVKVTDANKEDLTKISGTYGCKVTGFVQYDPDSKTLKLHGASIHGENSYGIRSDIKGLTIDVVGDNTVTSAKFQGGLGSSGRKQPSRELVAWM